MNPRRQGGSGGRQSPERGSSFEEKGSARRGGGEKKKFCVKGEGPWALQKGDRVGRGKKKGGLHVKKKTKESPLLRDPKKRIVHNEEEKSSFVFKNVIVVLSGENCLPAARKKEETEFRRNESARKGSAAKGVGAGGS